MVPISVIGLAYGAAPAALLSGRLALAVFYTRGRARARGTAVAQPADPQAGGRIGGAALQSARTIDWSTRFGERFEPRARRVMDEIEGARQEMDEMLGLRRGHINLGALPTLAPYLLPSILSNT